MYVKNHLLPKERLTIVTLDESIGSALKKLNDGDFMSLPVLDGNEFKGILMKEAIFRNFFENNSMEKEEYLVEVKVKDLYNENYKSIHETELIENASYLLKEYRTPFLPVFDNNENFVGILTHFAIFKAFSEVFGFERGSRIVINLFDIPGQLAKLTEVIRKEEVNIINLAVMDAKILDVYKVIVRVDTEDIDTLVNKIDEAGFKIAEVTKLDE